VQVGYQPEGIVELDDKLYVANSGGLKSDYSYDNRISVIDLRSFKVEREISVAPNLQQVIEEDGSLYVSTLGNYYDIPSGIYKVDPHTGSVSQPGDLGTIRTGGRMHECNGAIYTFNTEYAADYSISGNDIYVYDIRTGKVSKRGLDKGTVTAAYGICVNEDNGDIYLGDAKDYQNPGAILCFDKGLNLKWSATAGVDPGHLLLWKK